MNSRGVLGSLITLVVATIIIAMILVIATFASPVVKKVWGTESGVLKYNPEKNFGGIFSSDFFDMKNDYFNLVNVRFLVNEEGGVKETLYRGKISNDK